MKKNDIPQDKTHLTKFTREVVYAQDNSGHYEKNLSQGWNVKNEALDNAWENINREVEEARLALKNNEKSPVYFFMKKNLMDTKILASYTGIWPFFIKRHFTPRVFKKLKERTLKKYAEAFEITVEELKNVGENNQK